MFVDPAKGDFRVKDGSPALKLGFQNFPMDRFGVQKPELKKIARTPEIPLLKGAAPEAPAGRKETRPQALWQQARVKNLEGEEYSAFGVSRESGGVHLVDVPAGSLAARAGFRNDDLIQGVDGQPVRRIADLVRLQNAAGGKPLSVGFVRQQQPQKLAMEAYLFVSLESSPDGSFKTLPLFPADRTIPIKGIATQPETHNEPAPTLHDGQMASNYGPVFGNGDYSGLYKIDLGESRAISSIGTWSFNQNGNRGAQAFTLYGSAAAGDPGWNVGDPKAFTPIAEVDTAPAGEGKFHASSVRHSRGESLGSFRWLVWAAHPLNSTGEHSAYQELQVLPAGR
jgi:membrane-associated protease RseP (regulator of RpoE activity)